MIKTVLLDLDDTLLGTDTDAFVMKYLQGFTRLIIKRHPELQDRASAIGKALGYAAQATAQNLDPTRTNAEVFNETLVAYSDLPSQVLQEVLEEFHRDGYQQLVAGTQPIPLAPLLLKRLADHDLSVAIATNPLFTLDAIQCRIEQAGLDSAGVSFAFITNLEECHFSKPNPHYYEEVLARIGAENDQAIMVGDSFVNDMLPAAQAGLNTFWLNDGQPLPADLPTEYAPNGIGTLEDFYRLVDEGWLTTLQPRPRTADQVIPRLLGNVGAIYGLVDLIDKPEYWELRPDPDQWSLLEIMTHLRDSERTIQRPRLQRIATGDNPFISQPAAPPGPGEVDLTGENGHQALRQFWEERCQTTTFLSTLNNDDWQRPARHSIFGPTTLLEMAHFTARHDRLHAHQLCETLGRCYKQGSQ